jgi:hypothetical protein
VTLEQIVNDAYVRFKKANGPDTVNFLRLLEERGIISEKKEGYVKVFKGCPLYIPPELAERMLILGYLP